MNSICNILRILDIHNIQSIHNVHVETCQLYNINNKVFYLMPLLDYVINNNLQYIELVKIELTPHALHSIFLSFSSEAFRMLVIYSSYKSCNS